MRTVRLRCPRAAEDVARFNRTVRDEWRSPYDGDERAHVRHFATEWRRQPHHERLHLGRAGRVPKQRGPAAAGSLRLTHVTSKRITVILESHELTPYPETSEKRFLRFRGV